MFADDLKIFSTASEPNHAISLQDVISALGNWCVLNRLPLNIEKCVVMSFTCRRAPIYSDYYLLGSKLERKTIIKDLGVFLDVKLNFNVHIDHFIKKSNRAWGLIRRYSSEFTDPYVLKSLYVVFVRSILEYCSIIWSFIYSIHINRIEAIQKKFIRFTLRGLAWNNTSSLPPYESRLLLLNIHFSRNQTSVLCGRVSTVLIVLTY